MRGLVRAQAGGYSMTTPATPHTACRNYKLYMQPRHPEAGQKKKREKQPEGQ